VQHPCGPMQVCGLLGQSGSFHMAALRARCCRMRLEVLGSMAAMKVVCSRCLRWILPALERSWGAA